MSDTTEEKLTLDTRCLVCGEKVGFLFSIPSLGMNKIIRKMCSCDRAKRAEEDERLARMQEEIRISNAKSVGLHDKRLMDCTFDKDISNSRQIQGAKRYVETWPERFAAGDGLLFAGNVGAGKTFAAACIANALIEQGSSVMMTNFSKILNSLTGLMSEEKNAFIANLMRYSLLVIDDFGIERSTEFAVEQVYNVIDERYKTKKPLIVTTNMSITELKNPAGVAYQRVYDRVLAMCAPVLFDGPSFRTKEQMRQREACKSLFD